MKKFNLLIHFAPGARGDFLASVLLNSFNLRDNNALQQPRYYKIHHLNLHNNSTTIKDIKEFNGIKIRVDPGNNAEDLVSIEVNHLEKNTDIKDLFYYEKIYSAVKNFILLEKDALEKNKDSYDYWVQYPNLFDIEFLTNLYELINNEKITNSLQKEIKNNIKLQLNFTKDIKTIQLTKLIDFEIKNNLLEKRKNFVIAEHLDNLEIFLDLQNYSDKI